MSTVPPPAQALSTTGAPFAGFWIRLAAALIDGLFLIIPGFIIGFLTNTAGPSGVPQPSGFGEALQWILYIGYYVYFNGGKWQATPGKRILGIHIMRADGNLITYPRALGRYFAGILSAIILLVGYIMVAFTREKTALHDLLCDTRVVYGKR